MKKSILSTMVVLALVLGMAVSSFAATFTAAYATTAPVIDGEIDAIWETTEAIYTNGDFDSDWYEGCASGSVRILWDETALYFLAEIQDFTPVPMEVPYNDFVNLWVSEFNTRADSYEADIGDYLFCICSNGMTGIEMGDLYIDNAAPYQASLSAAKRNDSGYVAEVMIPYCSLSESDAVAGHVIGFVMSVDDDWNSDGERDCYTPTMTAREAGIYDDETYWSDTASMAEVEFLAGEKAEEPAVDPEEPAVDPEEPSDDNPGTADVTAIFYALASLSAVGGVALIGKRK